MKFPLGDGDLLIRGNHSFLLAGKAKEAFALCVETSADEFCQGVTPGDVIVVSAPEGGHLEPALILLDLVRSYHVPLLVLPRDHPGSRRISRVVSVAPEVSTSCTIRRGTHPEQHLVCSSDELAGLTIRGCPEGIEIEGLTPVLSLQVVTHRILTDVQ